MDSKGIIDAINLLNKEQHDTTKLESFADPVLFIKELVKNRFGMSVKTIVPITLTDYYYPGLFSNGTKNVFNYSLNPTTSRFYFGDITFSVPVSVANYHEMNILRYGYADPLDLDGYLALSGQVPAGYTGLSNVSQQFFNQFFSRVQCSGPGAGPIVNAAMHFVGFKIDLY